MYERKHQLTYCLKSVGAGIFKIHICKELTSTSITKRKKERADNPSHFSAASAIKSPDADDDHQEGRHKVIVIFSTQLTLFLRSGYPQLGASSLIDRLADGLGTTRGRRQTRAAERRPALGQ